MANYGSTDRVRRSAKEQYVEPARRRGQQIVKIHSGTFGRFLVEQKLLPPNRFPIVCNALQSKRFVKENNLTLQEIQGPPSGRSSTVTFIYKINPAPAAPEHSSSAPSAGPGDLFLNLRGVLKKTYERLGGADTFHRRERERWNR